MIKLKTIPDFPNYAISKDGKIWSKLRTDKNNHNQGNKWVNPRIDRKNYLYVNLHNNFGAHTRRVHRLVLETYRGFRPTGMQCRHLNGVRSDNRINNLKWGTPQENINDRARMGMTACGERQGASKLSIEKIKIIRYLRKVANFSLSDLAWQFGVDITTIGRVVNRKTWRHI